MVNADYLKVSFNDPLMAYCIDLSNLSALLKRLLKDICIESELKKIVSENEHVREWKNIKLIFSEWVTEYIKNQQMTIPLDILSGKDYDLVIGMKVMKISLELIINQDYQLKTILILI